MDKHKTLKKVLIIILIIAAGIFILDWGVAKYKNWKETKDLDKLVASFKAIEQKDYEMAMADTYGGKTPQETLDLFIDAVQKQDYELASKYFIIPKQEEELKSLQNAPRENIENVLGLLRQVKIVDKEVLFEEIYKSAVENHIISSDISNFGDLWYC